MMSSGRLPLDSSYRTLIGGLLLRVTARTEIQTSVVWAKINSNRPYSYSRYWTGTSLQWRLMWGIIIKAGVNLKAIFLLGFMVWMQISRSPFKQWKISLLISHSYVLGCFVNFFGDFWVYLGINSLSQRISKIYGNRKFWRFDVVLKLEFEVRNW